MVTVAYSTTSGTAIANEAYVHRQGTFTFLPLEFVKTVQIPIINDKAPEEAEAFSLVLSNPTGSAGLSEIKKHFDRIDRNCKIDLVL